MCIKLGSKNLGSKVGREKAWKIFEREEVDKCEKVSAREEERERMYARENKRERDKRKSEWEKSQRERKESKSEREYAREKGRETILNYIDSSDNYRLKMKQADVRIQCRSVVTLSKINLAVFFIK